MHRINYFFIAIIFLFGGLFMGMFITTWHYLDNPVVKEVDRQPVNVDNNYYLQYDKNYFVMPKPPIPPKFLPSKTI